MTRSSSSSCRPDPDRWRHRVADAARLATQVHLDEAPAVVHRRQHPGARPTAQRAATQANLARSGGEGGTRDGGCQVRGKMPTLRLRARLLTAWRRTAIVIHRCEIHREYLEVVARAQSTLLHGDVEGQVAMSLARECRPCTLVEVRAGPHGVGRPVDGRTRAVQVGA